MSQTINMLNEIYQNATMGVQGTELLISKTEELEFSGKLKNYVNKYNQIKADASKLLVENGESPQETTAMEKANLWMGVQLNTLIDKTPSHMAEMLIQGSTMGIIKSTKDKNSHKDVDEKCLKLEDELVTLQQDYIEDMKQYLK